jgi:UDP-glucose 4-epimerase
MTTQKAVVTGASGFIGQNMVRNCVAGGLNVLAIDLIPVNHHLCEERVIDLRQPGALDQYLDEATVVYHFAAHADVATSVKDPKADFEANIAVLIEVLESIRRKKSRMIFPSTASIFDQSNALPLSERSYIQPSSPYAAAKAAGEAYCAAYHRSYGLNIKIARMFSVYGKGMNRFAIHDIIQKIRRDPTEISILGDGRQIRDYLYINDAIEGLRLIDSRGKPGEDYNLGSGIPVTLIDLARKIAFLMGRPEITIIPTGVSFPGDVPKWYANIDKIAKIGFSPSISLDQGLKMTIEWMEGRETSSGRQL